MSDSSNWRVRAPVDPSAQPRRTNYASRAPREDRPSREGQPLERQPNVALAERSRSDDVKVYRPNRQHEDSPETATAIMEGRRIYLGNLLYSTTPKDVEEFLVNNGFPSFVKVHISVDPFSGRNPGYCFVVFAEKETADEVMEKLEGVLMFDRPVKCRPCQPKGNMRQPGRWQQDEGQSSSNSRWGNWDRSGSGQAEPDRLAARSGPSDAMKPFQSSKAQEEGRQLYVGGLPRMLDQAENEVEIRDIFKDFEVDGVSKRVSPRESGEPGEGRRNFCFVDFTTREQAQAAKSAIHGISYREAPLKVSEAVPKTDRYANRAAREPREPREQRGRATNRDIRLEE
ncbi:RNA recognition domain-containing protein [Seiridium cupressi]